MRCSKPFCEIGDFYFTILLKNHIMMRGDLFYTCILHKKIIKFKYVLTYWLCREHILYFFIIDFNNSYRDVTVYPLFINHPNRETYIQLALLYLELNLLSYVPKQFCSS